MLTASDIRELLKDLRAQRSSLLTLVNKYMGKDVKHPSIVGLLECIDTVDGQLKLLRGELVNLIKR